MHRTILSSHPDPRVRRASADAGLARAALMFTIAHTIWCGLKRLPELVWRGGGALGPPTFARIRRHPP